MTRFGREVGRLAAGHTEDSVLLGIVETAADGSDAELAELASVLARSGELLDARALPSCDVASTGGPTSLSTLLCPLQLVHLGFMVPKVGVEGRPAGAIDVLATIPGYSVDLDVSEVMRILTENSYVHVLARRFVPLDQQLFAFRKEHDAIDVPPLAIASLLSKKVAVGLERAGLDVRVARHGNFGESLAIASANASRFCRVAALLGIEATCVLTDARRPYQPFLGRGESLVAIDGILQGSSDPWLDGHANLCWHISCEAAGASEGTPPSGDVLKELFSRNLQAQGSSMSAFDERVDFIKNADRVALEAHRDGYVHIDLGQLRSALLQLQESGGGDPDPAGVILRFEPDSPLSRGDLIAEVRHPGKTDEIGTIASAFTILDDLSIRPFSPQVVRNV